MDTVKRLFLRGPLAACVCTLLACTANQQAQFGTACHVATAVEAADPAIQAKYPGATAGVTLLCAAAPVLLVPPPTPPTTP